MPTETITQNKINKNQQVIFIQFFHTRNDINCFDGKILINQQQKNKNHLS